VSAQGWVRVRGHGAERAGKQPMRGRPAEGDNYFPETEFQTEKNENGGNV
jgi:hypothetical protein